MAKTRSLEAPVMNLTDVMMIPVSELEFIPIKKFSHLSYPAQRYVNRSICGFLDYLRRSQPDSGFKVRDMSYLRAIDS